MPLRILAPEAFRPTLSALIEAHAQAEGQPVEAAFGPATGASGSVTARLEAGEACDIVFLPAALTDRQITEGRIAPECRIDVMRSLIALCVREGSPRPDISTMDALRDTLRAARSIGLSQAGSGVFVRETLLHRLEIADQVAPRCTTITGRPVGAAVAAGEVDLGLQQLAELMQEQGIDIVGPLPDAAQGFTVIAASVPTGGARLTEAQATFLAYLRSDEAAAIMCAGGLFPLSP